MCNTKKTRSAKYRTPYLYNTFLITLEKTVLQQQEMVISRKLCTNNSQSKCQNIKVSYKSASQVQWMQNIYITECFKVFRMVPQCHSGFQLEQGAMRYCKGTRRALGHSPGEPGTELCNYGVSPWQTEIAFNLHDPNGFTRPIVKNM